MSLKEGKLPYISCVEDLPFNIPFFDTLPMIVEPQLRVAWAWFIWCIEENQQSRVEIYYRTNRIVEIFYQTIKSPSYESL